MKTVYPEDSAGCLHMPFDTSTVAHSGDHVSTTHHEGPLRLANPLDHDLRAQQAFSKATKFPEGSDHPWDKVLVILLTGAHGSCDAG